jgi:hypothetical protein
LLRNFTAEAKAKWYCWLIIIQIIKDKNKKNGNDLWFCIFWFN